MLKFVLVNDFNINEGFEITMKEMGALAREQDIFMCMKDSLRISQESPAGVMAFHPSIGHPGAWGVMVQAITDARREAGVPVTLDEPVPLKDGRLLRRVPVIPADPELN